MRLLPPPGKRVSRVGALSYLDTKIDLRSASIICTQQFFPTKKSGVLSFRFFDFFTLNVIFELFCKFWRSTFVRESAL